MQKHRKFDMWVIVSLALTVVYCLFMVYPLLKMLMQSVQDEATGVLTLKYFARFFSDPYYIGTLWNSIKVSICATAITIIITSFKLYTSF